MLLLSLKLNRLFCVRKASCLFFFGLSLGSVSAQNVAQINNKPISSKEFMWAYKKSHNGIPSTDYNSLLNYLDLFIDFKLKVMDAREMGMDKSSDYAEEVRTYEHALSNHKKVNNRVKEFDYLLNEYREGVLMFNVSEQKIWNKAQNDEQAVELFYKTNSKKYTQPLSEIRGQVIADYQESLEEAWLKKLHEKYSVKINDSELHKLAKKSQ